MKTDHGWLVKVTGYSENCGIKSLIIFKEPSDCSVSTFYILTVLLSPLVWTWWT